MNPIYSHPAMRAYGGVERLSHPALYKYTPMKSDEGMNWFPNQPEDAPPLLTMDEEPPLAFMLDTRSTDEKRTAGGPRNISVDFECDCFFKGPVAKQQTQAGASESGNNNTGGAASEGDEKDKKKKSKKVYVRVEDAAVQTLLRAHSAYLKALIAAELQAATAENPMRPDWSKAPMLRVAQFDQKYMKAAPLETNLAVAQSLVRDAWWIDDNDNFLFGAKVNWALPSLHDQRLVTGPLGQRESMFIVTPKLPPRGEKMRLTNYKFVKDHAGNVLKDASGKGLKRYVNLTDVMPEVQTRNVYRMACIYATPAGIGISYGMTRMIIDDSSFDAAVKSRVESAGFLMMDEEEVEAMGTSAAAVQVAEDSAADGQDMQGGFVFPEQQQQQQQQQQSAESGQKRGREAQDSMQPPMKRERFEDKDIDAATAEVLV